jgi:branched-chain amino acid transport system substrate-binding protein
MINRYHLFGLFLTFALFFAGCAAPATEAPTQALPPEPTSPPAVVEPTAVPLPPAPEFIEIGAVIPLTGAFGGGGVQVKNGYEFAVEAINAAGGVYVAEFGAQVPLRLNILDDESDPTKTVSHLETLYAEQDVTAYLGGFGSSLHAAAAAIAEKNQVPYLGVAFAQWDIHQQGYEYLFSPFWKSPEIATEVFKLLNATIPEGERPTKVAIFTETTDWGIELGALWEQAAPEYGYEVVVHGEYAPLTADFTDLILNAQAAEADMVLAQPIPPDGVTLFRQMGELGWAPKFSFVVRAPDNPVWAENLGTVGDFVTLGPGWHNAMDYEGVVAINEQHVELLGRPADPMVGPAYAAVQILADAIERAGSLDRAAIRAAISATDLETVIGLVTFRPDGTGNVSSPILQYINGKQELVWPLEFATAEFVYPAPPYDQR